MTAHITTASSTTARLKPGLAPVATFLGLVFLATWVVWVPRALESQGLIDSHWAHSVGRGWTWAPAIAAVLFLAVARGRPGISDLRRRLLLWRIGWRWYAAVAGIPVGVALGTAVIYGLTGGQFSGALPLALDLPLPLIPLILAIRLLTDGIGEETAWRGVALPQLLRRMNAVTASLILGIVWATWHLPLMFTDGAPMASDSIVLLFVLLPAQAVVYTWLYQRTRGSILVAALFHAQIGLWALASPAAEATGRLELIRAILWCLLAAALLLKFGPNLTDRHPDPETGPAAAPNPAGPDAEGAPIETVGATRRS